MLVFEALVHEIIQRFAIEHFALYRTLIYVSADRILCSEQSFVRNLWSLEVASLCLDVSRFISMINLS
jgi:hypothetical protein